MDVDLPKNNAVDGAGRADVGHGANVGDLVKGDHQLKIGDRDHVQLVVGDQDRFDRQIDKLNERKFNLETE